MNGIMPHSNIMNGLNGTIQIARTFCPIQKWQGVTKMVEQIARQIANRTE
jgi:hypothetical protein